MISPEIREVMERIEQLLDRRARQAPGSGYTETDQLLGAATYWGAPKLVAALRTIEAAQEPEAHDLMCDDQLVLDLAA